MCYYPTLRILPFLLFLLLLNGADSRKFAQKPLATPPKSKWDFKPGPEIPGGSGFYLCTKSASTDLMQIDHMEMYPSPPVISADIYIGIYGTFLKNITAEPLWNYEAYWSDKNETGSEVGTQPFCEMMEGIEQPNGKNNTCPPEKGGAFIGIWEWVPGWRYFGLIGGTYVVEFDAQTQEGERIYCLTAKFYLEPEKN